MTFIRNAWYAAGWIPEDAAIFGRTILQEPIVFFRQSNGEWAAVANRCPHRFAPLDKGKVVGDALQCGYHGLRFDRQGVCVHNPIGNGAIPRAAKVRAYPVASRHKMIWIWMGDAALADPDLIPDYSILSDPNWVHATGGYIRCAANYQLVIDNLLDLSHVAFLHPLLGSQSMSHGKLSVKEHGTTIQSDFWMSAIEAPPFFEPRFKAGSSIDHWLDMRWHAPSSLLLDFGATAVGAAREEGFQGWATHILTPETESTVHYFFSIGRLDGPGAVSAAAKDHEIQRAVFSNEDKPMLEACQQLMGTTDLFSLKPVLLGGDAAAVRARRMIERLLAAEASGAATLSLPEALSHAAQVKNSEPLSG